MFFKKAAKIAESQVQGQPTQHQVPVQVSQVKEAETTVIDEPKEDLYEDEIVDEQTPERVTNDESESDDLSDEDRELQELENKKLELIERKKQKELEAQRKQESPVEDNLSMVIQSLNTRLTHIEAFLFRGLSQ